MEHTCRSGSCDARAQVASYDKETKNGLLATIKCTVCGYEWQTIVPKPKDQELKDILDVIGD